MKLYSSLIVFTLMVSFLSSCGQLLAAPTLTPVPTSTLTLTPTTTTTPALTPTPTTTLTPAPTSVIPLGKLQVVEWGGFSFRAPEDYTVETKAYNSTLVSPDMSIIIMLSGEPNVNELSLDDLAADLSNNGGDAPVTLGEIIEINGEKGMVITMDMGLFKMYMALALPRNGKQEFTVSSMIVGMSGISGESDSDDEPSPEEIVQEILKTVEFFDIPQEAYLPEISPATCAISADSSYGFSKDNPVVVYSYPLTDLTEKYLQLIAGPNGEEISVVVNEETTITIDPVTGAPEPAPYVFTYNGQSKQFTLYIVKVIPESGYIYQPPLVPAGFTCKTEQ